MAPVLLHDKAPPSSAALNEQPFEGRVEGFDFGRDALGSQHPKQLLAEIMKEEAALRPKVMALQQRLPEARYDLKPKLHPTERLSRGKPVAVGPTARLANGLTWEALAGQSAGDIRAEDAYPHKALPHPKHVPGAGVPAGADGAVPAAGGVRRGARPAGRLPAGVPAGGVPAEPAGVGGRVARARRHRLTEFMAIAMGRMQNMLDFPPALKLSPLGRLDPARATEQELRGGKLFYGKARCAVCHPAPFFTDHQMHDLHLERFLKSEPGDGPIKGFTLRGIEDSPPYLHDGRCLTLEDTVEFFNLVLGLKLNAGEKADLTAFLRQC